MPVDNYTGKYSNEYFGTIEITNKENSLAIKMGNINCVSTSRSGKETIRVEMVPGSGEVIRFKKMRKRKLNRFGYAGAEFCKNCVGTGL